METLATSRSRFRLVHLILALITVAVAIAVGGYFFGGSYLRDASMKTREAAGVVELDTGGSRAQVPVPTGWATGQLPWDRDFVRLRSPDGALTLDLWLVPGSADSALVAASSHAGLADVPTAVSTESLSNGMTWKHADVPLQPEESEAGSSAKPFVTLIASGGRSDSTDAMASLSVEVVASIQRDGDAAIYRSTIAQVLAGIEVSQ